MQQSRRTFYWIFSLMISPWMLAQAQSTTSLQEVWKVVEKNSYLLQGQSYEIQAAQQSQESAENHDLPRFYMDLKSYQTNDPGTNFFGLLQQRSLQNSDFAVDSINHPSEHLFHRASLGVDLNLYEGGFSKSVKSMKNSLLRSNQLEMENKKVQTYAEVGYLYGSLAIVLKQEQKMLQLEKQLQSFIQTYQLGAKSNPVGYSGLLGLKSFANRLKSYLNQYKSEKESYRSSLEELGWKVQNWTPEFSGIVSFLQKYFPWENKMNLDHPSYAMQSMQQNIKSMQEMVPMEKSKLLPRAGVFAETYLFQGNRDTSQGAMAGVYLQWNLFHPETNSNVKELQFKNMAAEKFYQAQLQQENLQIQNMKNSVQTLQENLLLIQQNDQLSQQQTQTMISLFKNGSVHILQLIDLLNRRAEILDQEKLVEIELLKTSSQSIQKVEFQFPEEVKPTPKDTL
jgi:hypothetical protein